MILVSRADPRRPADVSQHLLALHAPEGLGLAREAERAGV
jgi:hypothetical protein